MINHLFKLVITEIFVSTKQSLLKSRNLIDGFAQYFKGIYEKALSPSNLSMTFKIFIFFVHFSRIPSALELLRHLFYVVFYTTDFFLQKETIDLDQESLKDCWVSSRITFNGKTKNFNSLVDISIVFSEFYINYIFRGKLELWNWNFFRFGFRLQHQTFFSHEK